MAKIISKIHKFLSYKNWQNIAAIVTVLSIIFGGVIFLFKNTNIKDENLTPTNVDNCDKPFVYVKGNVSFDRETKIPEDISTLKISFKGVSEECSHDISINEDFSYFVKADKCEGGEPIKFSISNDGYKLGSNSIRSSTCKISPIRIY